MAKKDPASPATTSYAYDYMSPRWRKISTLLGGTEAMRSAGREYLPQHPEESSDAYAERLSCAVLLNMVDMTLTSLVSRPFSSPISVGEDVPEQIRSILDDVDLQGTSLDRYSRKWFREGLAKGYSCTLVEFPRTSPNPDGTQRTLADDERDGLRPYLVHIVPENLISADYEVINGAEVLTEIRFREEVVKKNGFAQEIVERIRVVTPGHGEVWEKRKAKNGKVTWISIDSYDYDLNFVPAVIYYADREGFMLSKPPLLDLANLNIRWWQSKADEIAILTVARFPMLAQSGATDSSDLVVGPNSVLSVSEPSGRFYYVEHSGKAIESGREELQDLEEQMAEYGATMLKKRPGGATATARALDSAEVTSALQDMALGFQDSLNQVMYYCALWMRLKGHNPGGTFKVKTDFTLSDDDTSGLETITKARQQKDVSRKKYLEGLIRYRVLQDDFDFDANEAELKSEEQHAMEMATQQAKIDALANPIKAAPQPAAYHSCGHCVHCQVRPWRVILHAE